MREKLSDYLFAETIDYVCLRNGKGRVYHCGISFDNDLLICKDCLCFGYCFKRDKNNMVDKNEKVKKWF